MVTRMRVRWNRLRPCEQALLNWAYDKARAPDAYAGRVYYDDSEIPVPNVKPDEVNGAVVGLEQHGYVEDHEAALTLTNAGYELMEWQRQTTIGRVVSWVASGLPRLIWLILTAAITAVVTIVVSRYFD